MTRKEQIAIMAMLYAFDKYGAKRLSDANFVITVNNQDEKINFGEAYNICADMITKQEPVLDKHNAESE